MKLTDKEENLIKTLAEAGPLTGYAIFKKKGVMSNAYWEKTRKKLEKNKVLRRRGKGPYWLDASGVKLALQLGVSPGIVKRNAATFYEGVTLENMVKLCDLREAVGADLFKAALIFLDNGTFDLKAGFEKIALSGDGLNTFFTKHPEDKEGTLATARAWVDRIFR